MRERMRRGIGGAGATPAMTARCNVDWEAQPLGETTDARIAAANRCSAVAVLRARRRLGIPRYVSPRKQRDDVAFFWERVDKSGPVPSHAAHLGQCWVWKIAPGAAGYGLLCGSHGTKSRAAHRFAWELVHGPIPRSKCVCHRCDNRLCVNPAHLFVGTHADNNRDMFDKGRGPAGERNGQAILTRKRVRRIRALHARGGVSQRALAGRYRVSQAAISKVVLHKGWRDD